MAEILNNTKTRIEAELDISNREKDIKITQLEKKE